ncbi:MAG: PAS domain-containing sensor histidine kinase [Nitrospirae bacterium]|nr:PAS domain-containing sensor histidine kinase [Nitrospirota bacterium]
MPVSKTHPFDGARRISIWPVLAAALLVASAAAVTVGILREQAAISHRTEVLLTRIQGYSYRMNAMEWQVAGERRIRARMANELQGVRDKMAQTFSELRDFDPADKRLRQVSAAYTEYEKAMEETFRLIAGGKHDLARDFDSYRVDPAFEKFSGMLASAVAVYSLRAKEKDKSAFVVSSVVFLAAAIIIGLLFSRFQKARQRAELMSAEQGLLRWSEERFRSLIQNASDVLLLLDADATVSYASMSLHRVLGYRPEEMLNASLLNIVCPDDAPGMRDYLDRCVRDQGIGTPAEFCFLHAGGGGRHLEVIGNNLLHEPSVQKIVINCRDVTERKEAEEQLKTSREQLRNLSAHLQTLREKERTSIAREIHDELGQALTALKMDVSWLGKKYREVDIIAKKAASMAFLIDSTIATVKRISSELRPVALDDLGLTAALEWEAEEFQRRTGIDCTVTFHPPDIVLEKDLATAIFRIVQESLTNVIRHAEATRVSVSLEEREGAAVLSIEDNGKGITEDQIADSEAFGLIGIRERAVFLGGRATFEGSPGKGTVVTVVLPLDGGGK